MFFIDEVPKKKLKKVKFLLPFDMKNKKKGGVSILMTPNYESTKRLLSHPLITPKYYQSYYLNRSVMYFINGSKIDERNLEESTQLISEAYENIISKSNLGEMISIEGNEVDVVSTSPYITQRHIETVCKNYGFKIPKKINIVINRSTRIPEPTDDILYLNPKDTYNSTVFYDYQTYVDFCLYIYLLKNINPYLNKNVMYSIAIVLSGVFNKSKKDKWRFKKELKNICKAVDAYIKDKPTGQFMNNIVKCKDVSKVSKTLALYMPTSTTTSDFLRDIVMVLISIYENEYEVDSTNSISIMDHMDYTDLGADQYLIYEGASDAKLKSIFYKDRLRTSKDLMTYYTKVKEDMPFIKYTYLSVDRYKELNLLYDTSFYNDLFIRNSTLKNIKGYEAYNDLMNRMINDPSLNSYKKKCVIIPVYEWIKKERDWMINVSINPISCIYRDVMTAPSKLKAYKNTLFVFLGERSYFTYDFSEFDQKKDSQMFLRNIKLLMDKNYDVEDEDENVDSPKAITTSVIDRIEANTKTEIDNIEPDEKDKDIPKEKKDLVDKVTKTAATKTKIDDTLEDMNNDEEIKDIIIQMAEEPDNGPSLSGARAARALKLQNDILKQELKGKTIEELLTPDNEVTSTELEKLTKPLDLEIDSVNDGWKELSYAKRDDVDANNLNKQIVSIFNFLSTCNPPMMMVDIKAEDTSTINDIVDTYTVHYEDDKGQRFTVKVDIPKFVDNKYLKLRGNRKELPNQLFLMPVIKTGQDTVQIVTCYKKMFIYRFGSSTGRTYPTCSKLVKILNKNKYTGLKVSTGDNTKICNKYEVPIDYIDLASIYSKITTPKVTAYFNQDELRKFYEVDDTKGVPVGVDNITKEVYYFNTSKEPGTYSDYLLSFIFNGLKPEVAKQFMEDYNKATRATKYTYSRVSVLDSKIPTIVVCAYYEGLENTLKKAGIKYTLSQKRVKATEYTDVIKFKDGYLIYDLTYDSSLLMNGLRDCPTEDTSIFDINKKTTYTQYLDYFGGRVLADGLDNYYQLMIDPITYKQLEHYKLPKDIVSILLYANQLLADNKYVKHGNISSTRRLRRQEIIANNLYEVLSKEYGNYAISRKHGRGKSFSVKQSAVIDEFMKLNITADQSIINPVNEFESYTLVTPKGPSGLNTERAYTLDKRSYDDSMLDVLSMSTGSAGNVGIIRQATIDSNIDLKGGYINNSKSTINSIDPIKTLCMTEALTPMGTTHDDPFRVAMNFIQTSKHEMRCKESDPLLISNGADEALPYMISNTFVHKAKSKGKVIEKTDDHLIIEYKDGTHDYVDLTDKIEKNSSSGFYVDIKLDSDLKEGSSVKENQIVAYDKLSFSDKAGATKNIAYNIGCLAKIAILNTDEGYEDSAIISDRLSDKMSSDVVLPKSVALTSDTQVFNLCKKGQKVEEGDTLLVIQNSTEDEEINALLKNISGTEEDISELGRRIISSKVTGVVQDIVISRTVDKEELSPSLRKVVNAYEKEIKERKKTMEKYGISTSTLPSTDKLPMVGRLKKVNGVLIEIYLKYEDKFKVGDKMVYYSALKGVTKDIFPKGKEPKSQYRPDETIDALLSVGSINARMTGSIIVTGSINKVLIELTRQCKDILGIPYDLNL